MNVSCEDTVIYVKTAIANKIKAFPSPTNGGNLKK
jgi:hypothetical protein